MQIFQLEFGMCESVAGYDLITSDNRFRQLRHLSKSKVPPAAEKALIDYNLLNVFVSFLAFGWKAIKL